MSEPTNESLLPAKKGCAMCYFLRALWIAVRLCAVIVLIDRGGTFFYQGF
jgi:hypothetical protein